MKNENKKVFRELSKDYIQHLKVTDVEERINKKVEEIESRLRISNSNYAMLERIERLEEKAKQLSSDIMSLTWK